MMPATFLGAYTQKGILSADPFISIDQEGVGELVRIGVERGRAVRPDIKLGICGEHGGDPASIHFCQEVGPRLRLLLALSRADRAPCCGPGSPRDAGQNSRLSASPSGQEDLRGRPVAALFVALRQEKCR